MTARVPYADRMAAVELLRCAADLEVYESETFLETAARHLGTPFHVYELARVAFCHASGDGSCRSIQLEAARMLEEGWQP